jgi:hypothetical protein
MGSNIDLNKVSLGKGYIILTSSKPDQMTWGNSFSNNLIKSLREKDGMPSLNEAFAKARCSNRKRYQWLTLIRKRQTPVMKSDWTGNDIVLGAPTLEQVKEIPET